MKRILYKMLVPIHLRKKRRLKVAFITWQFPNWHNTFTFYEINELLRSGHKVSIFSIEDSKENIPNTLKCDIHYFSSFINEEEKALYPFHKIYKFLKSQITKKYISKKIKFKKYVLFSSKQTDSFHMKYSEFAKDILKAFPKIAESLKNFDLIHAGFGNNPATAAMILSKLSKIPYTFESHAYDLFVDFKHSREKALSASKIFTISNYNKAFLEEKHGFSSQKISIKRVTYNKKFLNQKISSVEKHPLIVSASRLHPIKALNESIDAFNIAYKCDKRLRYIIIGDGPLKENLEKQIKILGLKDAISLVGKKTNDEVFSYLTKATLFLALSKINSDGDRDGIPTSLIEAMSMGLPVIATNVSGIPELVENDVNGFLTTQGAIERVAEKILFLVSNPKICEKMGNYGKQKVLNDFSIDKNINIMTKAWREIKR